MNQMGRIINEHDDLDDIIRVLANSEDVDSNQDTLAEALGVKEHVLDHIKVQVHQDHSGTNGFLRHIFIKWLRVNGPKATFEVLDSILREQNCVPAAETLSQILAPSDAAGTPSKDNTATATPPKTNAYGASSKPATIDHQLNRRSEIDPDFRISDETWVVSLVRNAYRPDNTDKHTFLVLEGDVGVEGKIVFMDFMLQDGNETIRYAEYTERTPKQNPLVNRCKLPMMNIRGDIECKSYHILREDGERLVKSVKSDSENREKCLRYTVVGQLSIINRSSKFSGSGEGHNCYSWASAEIRKLNIHGIKLPEDEDKMAYILTHPGRCLGKQRDRKLEDWVLKHLGVIFVPFAAIALAIILYFIKLFYY